MKNENSSEENSSETLLTFLKKLPNADTIIKKLNLPERLNESVLDFMKRNSNELYDVENEMKCDLVVIQQVSKEHNTLLFDNRFLSKKRKQKSEHFLGIVLDKAGRMMKMTHELNNMPHLLRKNFRNKHPEKPLWELLKLKDKEKNPTNFEETIQFLEKHHLKEKMRIFYLGKCFQNCWTNDDHTLQEIEAFTTKNLTLGFRIPRPKKPKPKKGKKEKATEEIQQPPDEFQINHSAAVKVKLTGLNQAYALGCISLKDFENLSQKLSETAAAMWIELDDKHQARYVTFVNGKKTFQKELNSDVKNWKNLFDVIFEQKENMTKIKSKVLKNVIETLEKYPLNYSTAWKNCLRSLKQAIQNFKVAVYSKDDKVLHAIKSHFCYYLDSTIKKNFKGVILNANSKKDLTVIIAKCVVIFNFESYSNLDTTSVDALWPKPVIKNCIKELKHQPKQSVGAKSFTVSQMCKERGKQLSHLLLSAYVETGTLFMKQFQNDIFSLPRYQSLSSLAFNSIWTLYANESGHFSQGLEKTKAFHEQTLRKFANGGFSFSCREKINAGELLDPNGFELAQTIFENDVCSSYGNAASKMSTPSGFCTCYTWAEDVQKLVRCDRRARFQTFEFLSVYKTIYKIIEEDGLKIRKIFSNFHQLGFLQVNKFTIDLIIILDDGRIKLVAFDGAFSHGCRQGCPNLRNYVRNKTRQELEAASELRDQTIQNWCKELNENMKISDFAEYQVITSCHHEEYKVSKMKQFFESKPKLKQLVDGYMTDNELSMDDCLFSSDKLTYLAVVEGYIQQNRHYPPQKPLFLQDREKNWNRYSSTNELETTIFLSKDYLNYLIREHNFRVTKINKIFFYKKCYIFPKIYTQLVNERACSTTSTEKKQFLKNVINFSTGMYGYNEKKHTLRSKCRLVTKVPVRYFYCKEKKQIDHVDFIENTPIIFIQVNTSVNASNQKTESALPIFMTIIEFGKMTLARVFSFYDKYLLPGKIKLLYSNIDNGLYAISTRTIEEAVDPNHVQKFEEEKSKLFDDNKAGCLKVEFVMNATQGWRFVSHASHNYSIITNDVKVGVHKNASLSNVSTLKSYETACQLLKHKNVTISQERRTNKLAHIKTSFKNFDFSLKSSTVQDGCVKFNQESV